MNEKPICSATKSLPGATGEAVAHRCFLNAGHAGRHDGGFGSWKWANPDAPVRYDWRGISGVIHMSKEDARREIDEEIVRSRREIEDRRFRVRYIAFGYQAQVRIPRR